MQTMRESWTDERLDDFRAEVNRRFDGVDRRFDGVDRRFDAVDHRFDRVEGEIRDLRLDMKAGFERMDDRFERLYRLLITVGGAFIGTLIVAFAGLIATQL
jgi:hypothetical protein